VKKIIEYQYNVGDIIKNRFGYIEIFEQIKIIHHRKNKKDNYEKGYKYQCFNCGNIDTISEYNLQHNQGCNVCSNHKVLIGYNDIWTTNPELASLLANPEDGYKYMQNSSKRVDWKCPICESVIKDKTIYQICNYGLSCPKCSDGISYPEKFMYSVLEQLNIDFTTQLSKTTFKWCGDYRYDFYIQELSIVVETHGKQHYETRSKNSNYKKTLQEEQTNDKLKKELALQNGIKEENYIVINCKKSELEYIKNSILNNKKINKLFDLSNIDWLKCHEFACSSRVKEACNLWDSGVHSTTKIGNVLNLDRNTISKYLKKGAELGWCDYNIEINLKKKNKKTVICLNTKEIFKSLKDAAIKFDINHSSISQCCKNKQLFAGQEKNTGVYLQWQYYEEYLIKPKELFTQQYICDYIIYKRQIGLQHSKGNKTKIICLNTREVFESIREANKYYRASNISSCCQGKYKYAGKHPTTGEPLQWMYYKDYIKLNLNT
jgi:very-short-patch-repair endonuclease